MRTEEKDKLLYYSFWITIGMLIGGIIPIWPYGYYQLLRLVVFGTVVFAILTLKDRRPKQTVVLVIIGLIFNPISTVALPRFFWIPIDLIVAFYFFSISTKIPQRNMPEIDMFFTAIKALKAKNTFRIKK